MALVSTRMSRPLRRRMSPSMPDTSAAPTPWPRTSGAEAIQYKSYVSSVIGVGP